MATIKIRRQKKKADGTYDILHYETEASMVKTAAGSDVETVLTEKANKAQENWIEASLINNWVNNGAPFTTVGYFKDNFGVVHLKGVMKNGNSGWEALQLPVGYRASSERVYSAPSSSASGAKVNISSNGNIIPSVGGAGVWVGLDGISFRV